MAEITYTQKGDYLIPDIALPPTEKKKLTRYGRMRRAYLEKNKPILLGELRFTGELFPHLYEVQETAQRRFDLMMERALKKNPPPDKAKDQLGWVRHMTMLHDQIEEVIIAELINA